MAKMSRESEEGAWVKMSQTRDESEERGGPVVNMSQKWEEGMFAKVSQTEG